ncbi:MAG TPA: serine protease [Planktothrix sp.]
MASGWVSPQNIEQSKSRVASGFGDYLVESALTGYGAFRGAKAGYLSNQTKLITDEIFAGDQKKAGVVSISVGDSVGSGFAVDAHHIVTNMHVTNSRSLVNVSTGLGTMFDARVVDHSTSWDLALLRTYEPHGLTPLRLAAADKVVAPGTEVVTPARTFLRGRLKTGVGIHDSTGNLDQLEQKMSNSLNLFQKADEDVRDYFLNLIGGAADQPGGKTREGLYSRIMGVGQGWSGSPLVERKTGEVVGVLSGGFYNPKTYRAQFSESIKGVYEMLQRQSIETSGTKSN